MKSRIVLLLLLGIAVGCAAPIKMTQPLIVEPAGYNGLIIQPLTNDVVGEINPEVCHKIMVDAAHGIVKKELFPYLHVSGDVLGIAGGGRAERVWQASLPLDSLNQLAQNVVELHVTLIDYKKGSSFLRFIFGSLAGGGHVTLRIEIIDYRNRALLAAGTTETKIQGSFASEKNVVGPLSRAITKFVETRFLRGKVVKS